jgi:hypothetical protein
MDILSNVEKSIFFSLAFAFTFYVKQMGVRHEYIGLSKINDNPALECLITLKREESIGTKLFTRNDTDII